MGQVLFVAVAAVTLIRALRCLTAGRGAAATVSGVAALVYVFALWVPANLQAAALIQSKIERAGVARATASGEIDDLCLRWAIELAVVLTVEALMWLRSKVANRDLSGPLATHSDRWELTSWVLAAIGISAYVLFGSGALDDRAAEGQGLENMLKASVVTALAIQVYFRGFGRRMWLLPVALGVAFLLAASVRSPLLVVVCALIASEMRLGRLRRPGRLAGIATVVVAFVVVASAMSSVRSNLVRNTGRPLGDVLGEALANPWLAPYSAGLDTLDGYRFAMAVAPSEPARPLDLGLIVATFIPRAIWADKPTDIGVLLSAKYLGYSASGQFLSPVGYLILVAGSYIGGLALLALLTAALALVSARTFDKFWYSILLAVVIRFMIGGSAFDLYYGLMLALPALLIRGTFRTLDRSSRAGPRRTLSPLVRHRPRHATGGREP